MDNRIFNTQAMARVSLRNDLEPVLIGVFGFWWGDLYRINREGGEDVGVRRER